MFNIEWSDLDSTVFTLTIWIIPTTHIHCSLHHFSEGGKINLKCVKEFRMLLVCWRQTKLSISHYPLKTNQNKIKYTCKGHQYIYHNEIQNILSFLTNRWYDCWNFLYYFLTMDDWMHLVIWWYFYVIAKLGSIFQDICLFLQLKRLLILIRILKCNAKLLKTLLMTNKSLPHP